MRECSRQASRDLKRPCSVPVPPSGSLGWWLPLPAPPRWLPLRSGCCAGSVFALWLKYLGYRSLVSGQLNIPIQRPPTETIPKADKRLKRLELAAEPGQAQNDKPASRIPGESSEMQTTDIAFQRLQHFKSTAECMDSTLRRGCPCARASPLKQRTFDTVLKGELFGNSFGGVASIRA